MCHGHTTSDFRLADRPGRSGQQLYSWTTLACLLLYLSVWVLAEALAEGLRLGDVGDSDWDWDVPLTNRDETGEVSAKNVR